MPAIPPLPTSRGRSNPLRRIDLPDDLEEVTTIGDEDDPAAAGVDQGSVAQIWKGVTELFRSGVHPAVQVCVRRHGAVVVDRAIGHAHGNGPGEGKCVEKKVASPETPFVVYSGSKAITAFVVHTLVDRGLRRSARRRAGDGA